MMSLTHAAIATAIVGFSTSTADPLVMGLAVLGSQLPDLDTSTSSLGQILWPVSRWMESRFPHRSVTHSFIATGAIALCSLPLYFSLGLKPWLALWLGHLIACFSDTFTKQGVQLFWPSPVWCVFGSNPHRRLNTGGTGEYWVLAGAIALLAINVQITNSGGLVQQAGQMLSLRGTALETYNQNAATHHIYADISGSFALDRSRADGRYFVLGADGSEFIVTDGKAIYRTGENILVNRLTTVKTDGAKVSINTINLEDERSTKLALIDQSNSAVVVSGSLTVDYPDEIAIPTGIASDPKQFRFVSLSGSNVVFNHCPLNIALQLLDKQYIKGTITVKSISPLPLFNALE